MSPAGLLSALQYSFVRNMFIAGVLGSIACGIIGTYVVVKRLVFISGGVAHTCFGGIGLAYLLGFSPILGAVVFALGSALTLGVSSLKTRIREDSAIGSMWAVGMGLGILFMTKAPGIVPSPTSILFGDILLVKTSDLWLLLGLCVTIVAIVALLYRQLLALTFDEEFAKISGVPTELLYLLLLSLIALTVVLLLKVMGVILVIALLTMPATIGGLFTKDLKRMMILAVLLAAVLTNLGLIVAWRYDAPPGAAIVIVLASALAVAISGKRIWQHLAGKSKASPAQ